MIIAILGAECTGKSWLAERLAKGLADATGLPTVAVPEELRAWCDLMGRTPRREEQAGLAQAQQRAIEAALLQHPIVIADTTPLMIAIHSLHYFNDDGLMAGTLAWQEQQVAHTLLALPDLAWQADGIQRDGPEVQAKVHTLVRRALIEHRLPWSSVGGMEQARLDAAMDAVAPLARALPSPRKGMFSRLLNRNADPKARAWQCERCDDPDCEHRLQTMTPPALS